MAPGSFKISCEEFRREVNFRRAQQNAAAEVKHSELERVERRIRRIVDVITEDAAPIRALKQELVALEVREITLEQE